MSAVSLQFTGIKEAQAALSRIMSKVESSTRVGVAEGLAAINRQAQTNSRGRPGPNVRTGGHVGSFTIDGPRSVGLGRWEGTCGPTKAYSRRLELGGGNWPSGLKFPYLGPAVAFCNRTVIPQLMHRAWAQAVVV